MGYTSKPKGTLRNSGDPIIPEDILKILPNKIPAKIKEAQVFGKIVDYSQTKDYYILSKIGDMLYCLTSKYGKDYKIEKVSLKELENKQLKSGDMFPPNFFYTYEFATGNNFYFYQNADIYRNKTNVNTILNGVLK
jgi:hypothetical protein